MTVLLIVAGVAVAANFIHSVHVHSRAVKIERALAQIVNHPGETNVAASRVKHYSF
jgi:hypothetical protein